MSNNALSPDNLLICLTKYAKILIHNHRNLVMFIFVYLPSVWRAVLVLTGWIFLSACQPDTPPTNATKAHISSDRVVLDKHDVINIKPERYQPSFRLEGVLSPIAHATLSLPSTSTLQTLHIAQGSTVKKGQTIATFSQTLPAPAPITADDDTQNKTLNHLATDQIHQIPNLQPPSSPSSVATTDVIVNDIAIIAPIFGRVENIFVKNEKIAHPQGTAIANIIDDRQLRFVSPLPSRFAEHIRIGDAVNFSTTDGRLFNGQIAKITPDTHKTHTLNVHVHIRTTEVKKAKLTVDERVSGHIEYGQMSVGTLVPASAIFDHALRPLSLKHLKQPPHKPATPIHAFLWVIGQDERLSLLSIEVVEYFPNKDQYLISGVSLDGLIVATQLPKHAQAKQVRLR